MLPLPGLDLPFQFPEARMAQQDDPREHSYPTGRGYGHDYMRGGELQGGYGYSARPDYQRRRGERDDQASNARNDALNDARYDDARADARLEEAGARYAGGAQPTADPHQRPRRQAASSSTEGPLNAP